VRAASRASSIRCAGRSDLQHVALEPELAGAFAQLRQRLPVAPLALAD